VYMELGRTTPAASVNHVQPQHCIGSLTSLLAGATAGLAHCAGLQGTCATGNGSGEPDVDNSGSRRKSDQEQEREKDENDESHRSEGQGQGQGQGQVEFRQLMIDTANALLEPLGLSQISQMIIVNQLDWLLNTHTYILSGSICDFCFCSLFS